MSELKNYISNSYINLKLHQPFCSVNKNTIPLDLKKDIDGLISEDNRILDLVYSRALDIFNDLFDDVNVNIFLYKKWKIIMYNN